MSVPDGHDPYGARAAPAGRGWQSTVIPALALLGAIAGALLHASGADVAHNVWLGTLLATGGPVVLQTLRGLISGKFAADIVATLAIVVSLILGQPLAGLIVVLMQTGGEALERYAAGRASEAVRLLEQEAPRLAYRSGREGVERIAVGEIRVGDRLIVRPGDMIPCNGTVLEGTSALDVSRLTGEPSPEPAVAGSVVLSGAINGDGALVIRADALSSESLYARIVELVRSAEGSKPPLQRLADRYAVWFTPFALLVALLAWVLSHDVTRVLAVLVVATPCPLILAAPIAIIGAINSAARRQIIIRTGGALEQLSHASVAIFDKTGTLTVGQPEVSAVDAMPGIDRTELLHLAGALEQHSGHALAQSLVAAARSEGLQMPEPTNVRETPGLAVTGYVSGHHVAVGAIGYIRAHLTTPDMPSIAADGADHELRAWVSIDGKVAGSIAFAEALRAGVPQVVARLRSLGVRRMIILSGDRGARVQAVAHEAAITEFAGDLLADEKLARVQALVASREGTVIMVGDGVNDAPALAQADVGIALAGHGGGIAAEAADVVILNDDLSRVADAVAISKQGMRIARQSIWVGLALSAVAMSVAAAGHISPVAGALLQELIDVTVIANALRSRLSYPL